MSVFEWLRAGHIIFVIAWMAGLLIYPRLLIYRLEAEGDARFEAAMDKAAASLRKVIMTPSMALVWLFGLGMAGHQWAYYSVQPWFYAKVLLVLGLSGYHGWIMGVGRKVAAGEKPMPPKRLRMMNEIPFVIAILAVIMVVVQPFAR